MCTNIANCVNYHSMSRLASNPDTLLDGAMEQFARHGFAKTSMSDIASAAGISRTSLYKHFSSKEEVFQALSQRINANVFEAVVTALKQPGAWDRRLSNVIHARVSWVYDLLHASEFGRELINEKNKICGGDVLSANDRFQSVVQDILARENEELSNTAQLAQLVIQSVNGILEQAETKDEAQSNVELLIQVFCSGIKR